jgi:hypothetical protein
MRWNPTRLALTLMFAGLTACATHHTYYEASAGDVWGPGESTYYVRWETETHRDHVDWEKRKDDEHKAYWAWRHEHHDNDDHH